MITIDVKLSILLYFTNNLVIFLPPIYPVGVCGERFLVRFMDIFWNAPSWLVSDSSFFNIEY